MSAGIKVSFSFLTVHVVQISQLKFVKLGQNLGQLLSKFNATYRTVHTVQISRV